MATCIVKSNVLRLTDVLINDLGEIVPNSGGSISYTAYEDLWNLAESRDLRTLLTDNAYGAGNSTLILNDGSTNIAQADAANFLETITIPATGPYSIPRKLPSGLSGTYHSFCFTDASGNAYRDVTANSYTTIGSLLFPGTTLAPVVISKIFIWAQRVDGTDFDLRIYDVTNSKTICEKIDTATAGEVCVDLGTVSNLSVNPARWEIQALITGSPRRVRIYSYARVV